MNTQNKGKTVIDQEMFSVIKILIKSGETHAKIAEYMKVSTATVHRIRASETYEEYRNIMKAMAAQKKQKYAKEHKKEESAPVQTDAVPVQPEPQVQVVEHRQSIKIEATHYMMTEMQKTNELLALISNKLAFIVDELTGNVPVLKEG